MATLKTKLPFIAWRDGRPRFVPGARERDLGFKGEDLRHPGIGTPGAWFNEDETRAWARAKHADILARRAGGPRTPKAPASPRGRTVADLLDDWLASDEVRGLAASTQVGYRKQVDAVRFCPGQDHRRGDARDREPFSAAPVAVIGAPELRDFFNASKAARGHHMALAMIAVISAAMTWGRSSSRWRLGPNPRIDMEFERPRGRIVIYLDAELRALIAAADASGRGSIGDAVMLGIYTGQRQGDRLRLEDAGLVGGRRQFRQNKTKAIVAIPETPSLAARLVEARARVAKLAAAAEPTTPIATTIVVDETTGRPYNPHTYRHVFDEVRRLAVQGSKEHRLAPCPALAGKRDQDLRDTAVTWLARAGCTLPEISGVTGHSLQSIVSIMRHYLAITPEFADAAIAKLMAWMEREGIAV